MSTKDDLRFHDSGGGEDVMFEQTDGQTHTFSNFPDSAIDIDSDEEGRGGDKSQLLKEGDKKTHSFWTFEYYQQFFDVETWQVFRRVVGSMTPLPNKRYLDHNIRPNPDLYGPFWICTTLVFTTAIAGNLANYLASGGKDYNWHYDFHKVTFAASAIFSYWWLIPAVLYGVLWWRKSEAGLTFLEMLCVYGYSLAIYIPISILWVVNITWFKWVLVVLGAVLSGGVLVLTFWPAMKHDTRKMAGIFVGIIFILHLALAAGFVLYFFHIPPAEVSTVAPSTTKSDQLVLETKPEALTSNKGNANILKNDSGGVNDKQNGVKPDLEGEKQKMAEKQNLEGEKQNLEGEKQNLKVENRDDHNNVEKKEQSPIDLNKNEKDNADANDEPV